MIVVFNCIKPFHVSVWDLSIVVILLAIKGMNTVVEATSQNISLNDSLRVVNLRRINPQMII